MGSIESKAPPSATPPSPESFPLWIVEDDDEIAVLVSKSLKWQGYQAARVPSAEDALAQIDTSAPFLLLMDKNLPGMSGLELISKIRARTDDFDAVLMTAHADVDSLVRGMELGVFRCVPKPFELNDLQAAVAGAANRLFLRLDRRAQILRLEQALAQLRESENARLLSERLASIGKFAATLAHEINNPLAYVQTNLTVLGRDVAKLQLAVTRWLEGRSASDADQEQFGELASEFRTMVKECTTGVELMRQISHDLRSVSRYGSSMLERCDLNEVVRTACRVASVEPKVRGNLALDLDPATVLLRGSPGRLAQLVMNLVANAAEATAEGRRNEVTVRTSHDEKHAVLEVVDTGVGIAEHDIENIFEPFVSRRRGGTGIGLGLVQQIVTEHEGTIAVDSALGRGSTFQVSFPLAAVVSVNPVEDRLSHTGVPARFRLLFVDDDPLVLRAMGRAFGNHDIRLTSDAEEAIRMIAEDRPDVVISDLHMGLMDGIDFANEIGRRWPELAGRILFVSGTDALIERVRGEMPDHPLLRKPFHVSELERKIVELYKRPREPAAKPA